MTARITADGIVSGSSALLVDAAAELLDVISGVPGQARRASVSDLVAALTLDLDKDFLAAA